MLISILKLTSHHPTPSNQPLCKSTTKDPELNHTDLITPILTDSNPNTRNHPILSHQLSTSTIQDPGWISLKLSGGKLAPYLVWFVLKKELLNFSKHDYFTKAIRR